LFDGLERVLVDFGCNVTRYMCIMNGDKVLDLRRIVRE
jgi:hypothetical protein